MPPPHTTPNGDSVLLVAYQCDLKSDEYWDKALAVFEKYDVTVGPCLSSWNIGRKIGMIPPN